MLHSAWVSGQAAHSVDFGLVSLLNGILRQFLKIHLFPSVYPIGSACLEKAD